MCVSFYNIRISHKNLYSLVVLVGWLVVDEPSIEMNGFVMHLLEMMSKKKWSSEQIKKSEGKLLMNFAKHDEKND